VAAEGCAAAEGGGPAGALLVSLVVGASSCLGSSALRGWRLCLLLRLPSARGNLPCYRVPGLPALRLRGAVEAVAGKEKPLPGSRGQSPKFGAVPRCSLPGRVRRGCCRW
jgi:hypothetical protein